MDERDQALLVLGQALRDLGYRFVTPTPLTHRRVNRRPENRQARDLAGIFGWSRPFALALLPERLAALMRQADLLEPTGRLWRSRLRLSSLSGELFWHAAFPTLAREAVFFGPDTYRFAQAIEATPPQSLPGRSPRIVDIGTGSGAGAILAAQRWPDAAVLGLDINPEALRLARVNAALAGIGPRLELRRSDLLQGVAGDFDLILSNPPYLVDPDQRAYRHGGGPLGAGLTLRILEAALERLTPGGRLLLYSGAAMQDNRDPLAEAIAERLAGSDWPWHYRERDPDVFGEELLRGPYRYCERIAAVLLALQRPFSDGSG